MTSEMIVCVVKVDRTKSPQEMLGASGHRRHVDERVVASMPRGEGETVEVIFFWLGRSISDEDLAKEYELRGLIPVDPYSLTAINAADRALAVTHPNCAPWKDANGKWCYVSFCPWADAHCVYVYHSDGTWGDRWWFGGIRKAA